MVVALGALDPHSQEHLRHIFCHLQRVGFVLVVVGGRIAERASLARDKFAKELVDWHISLDPLLQPVVVEQHRLVSDLGRGADHQQFRPLHHPHLDEFLPLEQAIHEVLALGWVDALHECAVFVRAGERAANIEVHAPQKLLVGAEVRRVDPQTHELPVGELVNVVLHWRILPLESESLWQHDELRADCVRFEPGQNEGLSSVRRRDDAVLRHRG